MALQSKRTRTLLIVTAAQRDAANAVAVQVAGPYATDTFSVPYYQGQGQAAKPTHYVACWDLPDVQLAEFRRRMAAQISGKSVEVVERAGRAELAGRKLAPAKAIEQRPEK